MTTLIRFPHMHADAAPQCLDPGWNPGGQGGFTPQDLPMNPETARSYVRDMLGFAQVFESPAQLRQYAMQQAGDAVTPGTGKLRGEFADLTRFVTNKGQSPAKDAQAEGLAQARLQAQMTLLLALSLEQNLKEQDQAKQGLESSQARLNKALRDEEESDAPDVAALDDTPLPLPWKRLLECFVILLPDDAALYIDSPDILAELDELDFPFAAAEPALAELAPKPCAAARVELAELLGVKPAPEKPWLATTVSLVKPLA